MTAKPEIVVGSRIEATAHGIVFGVVHLLRGTHYWIIWDTIAGSYTEILSEKYIRRFFFRIYN